MFCKQCFYCKHTQRKQNNNCVYLHGMLLYNILPEKLQVSTERLSSDCFQQLFTLLLINTTSIFHFHYLKNNFILDKKTSFNLPFNFLFILFSTKIFQNIMYFTDNFILAKFPGKTETPKFLVFYNRF